MNHDDDSFKFKTWVCDACQTKGLGAAEELFAHMEICEEKEKMTPKQALDARLDEMETRLTELFDWVDSIDDVVFEKYWSTKEERAKRYQIRKRERHK